MLGGVSCAGDLNISPQPLRRQSDFLLLPSTERLAVLGGEAFAGALSISSGSVVITLLLSTRPSRRAMRRTHRWCPRHQLTGRSATSRGFVLLLSTRWPRDA